MQAAQRLRRLANRLRRTLRPVAGDEPAVEIEGRRGARPARLRRGRRRWRALGFALGFCATFAALSIGLAAVAAWDARAPADWTLIETPPEGGATAVAAALLELAPHDARDLAAEFFFLPTGRRTRADDFQAGAAGAVAAYAATLRDPRGRLAPALALAQRSDPEALRDARLALERRAGERQSRAGPAQYAALAGAAAADAAARAEALEAIAAQGRIGPLSDAARAAFFEARGAAFAWRTLLDASSRGLAPEARFALSAALAEADATLRAAAEHQPLFVLNPPPGARLWPAHVARQAERMRACAAAAAQLSVAAQLHAEAR